MKRIESSQKTNQLTYKSFIDLYSALNVASICFIINSLLIAFNGGGLFATTFFSLSGIASSLASRMMTHKNNQNGFAFRFKDVSEIKKLYDEFIKNYIKMNKDLNLQDPVELYTLFVYLLKNGYLSYNHQFHYSEKVSDISGLYGADILTGTGVCRHTSYMLMEILNGCGIDSRHFSVNSHGSFSKINIKAFPKNIKSKFSSKQLEELMNLFFSDEFISNYGDMIKSLLENDCNYGINIDLSKWFVLSTKLGITNHDITVAVNDGRSYFFDPTWNRIYQYSELFPGYLSDGKVIFSFPKNDKGNERDLRCKPSFFAGYPSVPQKETEITKNRMLAFCDENKDYFEKFYKGNKDIIEETTSKMLVLRR